jgi:hypothetical protein
VSFQPFEDLTLDSPNFEESDYSSGRRIQFADAVHRAQFFNRKDENWHTILQPQVVNRVTITVPRFVNIQLANGTIVQARSYFTGRASDGSTFVLMLNALFNFFFDSEVVNEITLGNFTTSSLNMLLFPNTFLFSLNVNNPNTPGGCCVLGFHTYFYAPAAVPQPRWVTQYASWISPGVFRNGIQDVTALSHETSEAFADPFVDNVTPSWQFPGVPANAKVCQSNLEEGDPIEVLPTITIPITIREGHEVFLYHPQNIPLLQWFEMGGLHRREARGRRGLSWPVRVGGRTLSACPLTNAVLHPFGTRDPINSIFSPWLLAEPLATFPQDAAFDASRNHPRPSQLYWGHGNAECGKRASLGKLNAPSTALDLGSRLLWQTFAFAGTPGNCQLGVTLSTNGSANASDVSCERAVTS